MRHYKTAEVAELFQKRSKPEMKLSLRGMDMFIFVLYFPMLIFSGATLPYEVMPPALQKAVDVLPLTQGIKLLKAASLGLQTENILVPVLVMVFIAFICIGISLKFFKWE